VTAAAIAAETKSSTGGKPAETYVKLLHDSLNEKQRKIMAFPFDHDLRRKVANNWHIVDEEAGAIGKLYTPDQQEMIRQILRGVTSEDGYDRFQKQMEDDDGGFENYTCALFGQPGSDKFEFVMTGRHLTIRADGNSVENAAFGGPIFYGHAVKTREDSDHKGNVWWHQAEAANAVFKALDGKQQAQALIEHSPADDALTVRFRGDAALPGIRCGQLSGDQKELLENTLKSLLAMFRESDVAEVMECLKKNGGVDHLHMSFYKEGDTGDDGVWDRWSVQGPAFIWYFRGSPHVHTWVNVGHQAPRVRTAKL